MLSNKHLNRRTIEKEIFERETGYWIDYIAHDKLFKDWPNSENEDNYILNYIDEYQEKLQNRIRENKKFKN